MKISRVRKKFLSIILSLVLILANALPAFAALETANGYTALGDSITYGMNAEPGRGYVDLFYNHLKTQSGNEGITFVNLGVPGETSSDLLKKLKQLTTTQTAISTTPAAINTTPSSIVTTMAAIATANAITISIGGNNLLQPTIAAFANAFKLDPKSPTFSTDLAKALTNPVNKSALDAIISDLQPQLTKGEKQFAADWADIVVAIKVLAPNAQLYATTLYNPFNQADPLFPLYDTAVQSINQTIKTLNTGYKVADSYTMFRKYTGAEPLVNFDLSTGKLDPHPTTKGHDVIYQAHLAAQDISNNTLNASVPIISSQPKTIIETRGNAVTLSVAASVTPGALSYQWYSSLSNVTTGGTIISGATQDTLSVPTTAAGITYYYCVITNTDNTATGLKTASTVSNAAKATIRSLFTDGIREGTPLDWEWQITFNQPMDARTLEKKIDIIQLDKNKRISIPITPLLDPSNPNVIIVKHSKPFTADTSYELKIMGGLKSVLGKSLTNASSMYFKTIK